MSLYVPNIDIVNRQRIRSPSMPNGIELRYFDNALYICRVDESGNAVAGAEIVMDALPGPPIINFAYTVNLVMGTFTPIWSDSSVSAVLTYPDQHGITVGQFVYVTTPHEIDVEYTESLYGDHYPPNPERTTPTNLPLLVRYATATQLHFNFPYDYIPYGLQSFTETATVTIAENYEHKINNILYLEANPISEFVTLHLADGLTNDDVNQFMVGDTVRIEGTSTASVDVAAHFSGNFEVISAFRTLINLLPQSVSAPILYCNYLEVTNEPTTNGGLYLMFDGTNSDFANGDYVCVTHTDSNILVYGQIYDNYATELMISLLVPWSLDPHQVVGPVGPTNSLSLTTAEISVQKTSMGIGDIDGSDLNVFVIRDSQPAYTGRGYTYGADIESEGASIRVTLKNLKDETPTDNLGHVREGYTLEIFNSPHFNAVYTIEDISTQIQNNEFVLATNYTGPDGSFTARAKLLGF